MSCLTKQGSVQNYDAISPFRMPIDVRSYLIEELQAAKMEANAIVEENNARFVLRYEV